MVPGSWLSLGLQIIHNLKHILKLYTPAEGSCIVVCDSKMQEKQIHFIMKDMQMLLRAIGRQKKNH